MRYVVHDTGIVNALEALGIPRTALFNPRATFSMRKGFDKLSENPREVFLVIETPEGPPEIHPNGTRLIGQRTGVTYVVEGYCPVSDAYALRSLLTGGLPRVHRDAVHSESCFKVAHPEGTVLIDCLTGSSYTVHAYVIRRSDGLELNVAYGVAHSHYYTAKPTEAASAPAKEDVYPNGTVLIGQYSGVAYTIQGYDSKTSTYTVWSEQDQDSFQSPREVTHNARFYRVKPAPTQTPAPEPDRFPVGTILRLNSNGKDYFVVGRVAPPEECDEGYRLWCINDKRKEWEEYPVAHDPKTYDVVYRPIPGVSTPGEGTPVTPFPVGTVLQCVTNRARVSCITRHTAPGALGRGYAMSCVESASHAESQQPQPTLSAAPGWERYDRAHEPSRYTVLYKPNA